MSNHLEQFRAMLDSIDYQYHVRERGPHTDIDSVMGETVVRLIFLEGRLVVFMADDADGYDDLEHLRH